MSKALSDLDSFLSKGNPFICGDHMSIADLLLFHETVNIVFYKVDLEPWKNVKSWYEKMLAIKEISEIHDEFQLRLPKIILIQDLLALKVE